jgi:hypothetical protein
MAKLMPSPDLKQIIGKAVADPEFCGKLYSDRAAATAGYSLTPEDHEILDAIPKSTIDACASGSIPEEEEDDLALVVFDLPDTKS